VVARRRDVPQYRAILFLRDINAHTCSHAVFTWFSPPLVYLHTGSVEKTGLKKIDYGTGYWILDIASYFSTPVDISDILHLSQSIYSI
jgi:hypothetical protein